MPEFEKTVRIEYIGILTGKTGMWAHISEQITPDFTFLRAGTICRPVFLSGLVTEEIYDDAVFSPISLQMTVNVPDDYMAVFSYESVAKTKTSDGVTFTASGEIEEWQNYIAIAKYKEETTENGSFYFVGENCSFMNYSMYYNVEGFKSMLRVVEIPTGLGVFKMLNLNIIFLDTDKFDTKNDIQDKANNTHVNPAFEQNEQLIISKVNFSILFIGNSQTHRNNVPGQLESIAKMYGINITSDTITRDGAALSDTMKRSLEAISANKYDYVVIQDAFGNNTFMADVKTLCDEAKKQGAIPVFYSPTSGGSTGIDLLGSVVDYEIAAKGNDALLIDAPSAWVYVYYKKPDIKLDSDDGHSNSTGAYLTACTIAATIFRGVHVSFYKFTLRFGRSSENTKKKPPADGNTTQKTANAWLVRLLSCRNRL